LSYQNAATTAPARLGRYELIGQLATGGMAEIHLAKLAGEAGFEKIVVVKRLLPELVASKQFVTMFLDEAKLVARLDHPNVCEVFELGRDGVEYFLVMPFLDGVPATELIARPRDPDRIAQLRVAAGIGVQACAGLHHAHELRDAAGALVGLVHRDVSPSNLFVTSSGVTKVLDFGIAKVPGAAETEAGTIKGKTQYMAPEQLLGEPLDRRADVFALGIVLYELATHQRLFKRTSDYLAARAILEEPIPRADAADPAIPPALADVIARALARRPADRYATARELGVALESALAAHGGIASVAEIATSLADRNASELSAQRTRQARIVSDAVIRDAVTASTRATTTVARRRSRFVAAGVVATIALGGAAVVTWRSATRGDTHDASATSGPRDPSAIANNTTRPTRGSDDASATSGPNDPSATANNTTRPTRGSNDASATSAPLASDANATTASSTSAGAKNAPSAASGESARAAGEPIADANAHSATRVRDAKPHAATAALGWFTIDSKPFATIFIDDAEVGMTPLIHKPIAIGEHRARAVLRDGREQRWKLVVRAGKAAPVQLTW
jgi:serine/threonine-protein kinase